MTKIVVVGILGVIVGVMIQTFAVVLQTSPSFDYSLWISMGYPFIFAGLITIVSGYAEKKEEVNPQIGLFLLGSSAIVFVILVLFYETLTTALFPRVSLYYFLVLDTVAIFFTGLLFPRITGSMTRKRT